MGSIGGIDFSAGAISILNSTLAYMGIGFSVAATNTFETNLADYLIAGENSRFAQLKNQYIKEGMSSSDASLAAGIDQF